MNLFLQINVEIIIITHLNLLLNIFWHQKSRQMNLSPQDAIKNLQDAIKRDDHNQAYQYSKILLKESPQDQQYQQCLIISALKINVVEDLQSMFKTLPTKQSIKRLYAYYLYFIGDYEKTISYLQSQLSKNNNASFKLLLAQAYFKINDQANSAKIMLELLKQSSKMQKQDLQMYLINLFATSLNQNLNQTVIQRYKNIAKQNYCRQIYYNYALLLITLQDYQAGLQCLSVFQNQLKKGQDQNDLKMVQVLKDYVKFKTLKSSNSQMDSQQIETKVNQYEKMQEQVNQVNLKNVIRNNQLFLKYRNSEHILQNFHQILRVIDQALQKKSKTTKSQQFVLKLNKFTLLIRKNRLAQAAKLLKDLQNNYQQQIYTKNNFQFIKGKYSLLKKSSKQNSKQSGDVLGYIKTVAKLHKNLAFCLLADLKQQEGNQKQLISEIKQANSHSSIIKNYIFSLLIKNPDLFEQYHQYLQQLLQKTNDYKILGILLKLYQNKKDLKKQQQVLTKILKINPKDLDSKVKLANICINQGKLSQAQQLLKGVQQPQQITDMNYLQHLEKNIHISIKKDQIVPETIISQNKKAPQQKENAVANTQALKKRIKKKRRPRYPKNMEKIVEGFKGDPQRWLPKWQRKGYKKKGKKGTGKTQGLATVGKQQTKNVFTAGASTSAKEVTKQATKKRK